MSSTRPRRLRREYVARLQKREPVPPPLEEEKIVVLTTATERVPRPIPQRRVSRPIPRRRLEPEILEETVIERVERTPSDNVEEELRQSGYAPVSKIVVNEGEEMEGRYIKAFNRYGQYVYVELDTEGLLAIEGDVITHTEVKEATEIPLLDAYKCVEGGVCGVVSECVGGICTLKREGESKYPRPTTLMRSEKISDTSTSAMLGGDGVAYPIIRLSEIRADPERALFAQNEATTQLRNQRNTSLEADVQEMADLLDQLTDEFDDFDELRDELTVRVENDLKELEADNLSYIEDPPVGPSERNQSEDIIESLARRNEIVINVLESTKMVTDLKNTIRDAIIKVQKAKKESLRNVNI